MTRELWTAIEAAAATGGALCARGDGTPGWAAEEWAARGISIDTRNLKPGDIFVALRDARDGHEFVPNAFDAGAAAALVAGAPENAPRGAPLLVVGDTLQGLRDLAVAARLRNFGKRIAITGSAGKTSTKEILRGILAPSGLVHAADKSFNNHFGVPLSLAQLPMDARYGVFEIGMNHAGEITPLAELVRPHAAIVTTVAAAHLEFFKSVDEIAAAKAEIFSGLSRGGVAILPADNKYFDFLKKCAEQAGAAGFISFGEAKNADFRLVQHEAKGAGAKLSVSINGNIHEFAFGIPGKHQAVNLLAALAAVNSVGASVDAAIDSAACLAPADGRGARTNVEIGGGTATLIDESYNANPTSMAAAIGLLGDAPLGAGGRRIAVLGEMLELGPDAPGLHAGLADKLAAAKIDSVFVAGILMDNLWEALPPSMRGAKAQNANDLVNEVIAALAPGDAIMVKGSNASGVSIIAKSLGELGQKENTV